MFPRKGVRLPKGQEARPFQTWNEIDRQIAAGASDTSQSELWDCLYLSMTELASLLDHVKQNAEFPFIHPMFAFAAYTGARRAEMMRSQISDIDLAAKVATIHEKKRVRGTLTTRRVPIAPPLAAILRGWLKHHPGGSHTFCHGQHVARSKNTQKRMNGPIALSRDETHHHFKSTLRNSQWKVLRGWHTLRHSFISNCASKGINQRMIDEWVGHTTEAMRRRYRHLFPSKQRDAMKVLFR